MTKICATCRRQPAVKYVLSDNGRKKLWKCQVCIDRRSVSFITAARELNQIRRKNERADSQQRLEEVA
jgi:hypothetical protein